MLSPDMQRILRIFEYCVAVDETIARFGNDSAKFLQDKDYQQSVAFSLLQIGELAKGLSEEYRRVTADDIPWQKIRGMRNLFAHDYGNMNKLRIWETATESISQLKKFCEAELRDQDIDWQSV